MLNNINGFRSFFATALLFFSAFLFSTFLSVANEPEHKTAHNEEATTTEETVKTDSLHHEKTAEEGHTEAFNAGKLIMEHIADAHDWHLFGHYSIPLPVIVYSSRGLDIFSSSHFEHGHKTYKGYMLNEKNLVVAVNELEETDVHHATTNDEITATIYDISITKNVTAMLISMALILWVFISIARTYSRNPNTAPKGMQSLMEPLIIFIRDDVAKASIGEKNYKKFMPFLLTVFFFILLNNLLGLVPIFPGGVNLTGNIAITFSLAFITFLITTVNGTKDYWRHIIAMPGVPPWVLVLLTPIEILGVFLRPFVLMIRLFANITAGHIIALAFFCLIFIFAEKSPAAGFGVSIVSVAFVVFMTCLELLVAFLQAYVFTLLSAIYFGSALEEHSHAEEHH
jgi:F-type H+-transporting ATPase subunit a